MTDSNPTADWNPLGQVYYRCVQYVLCFFCLVCYGCPRLQTFGRPLVDRKFEVYSMQWKDQVDLSKCRAVAAPFGGPIGKGVCLQTLHVGRGN